jgi:hypothetical protein
VAWTSDNRGLFVQRAAGLGSRVDRLDLATGHRELWREIVPSDAAGVVRISSIFLSQDGAFYVYAYSRVLSSLYVVEGLK